jgi:hypothetical protein
MSCYICLEEEGKLLSVRGCHCKGGLEVHAECLREWIAKADNPFKCSVCKGDYSGPFLKRFLSEEEILYRSNGNEEDGYEDEEEDDLDYDSYVYNGIPITNAEGMLCFETVNDMLIYTDMTNKEVKSVKQDWRSRKKNAARVHVKLHRQPKWSKRAPFRK